MSEIMSVSKIGKICGDLQKQGKAIVLAGGCFDILHPGHVIFLEKAKKAGDILIVLLESDEKVKKLKGANRPIHAQKDRAKVLSALRVVDYVVLLSPMEKDQQYDELITSIRPAVIATASKNTNMIHFQRAAKLVGAKLKLIKRVTNHSTSSITSAVTVQ